MKGTIFNSNSWIKIFVWKIFGRHVSTYCLYYIVLGS